MSESETEEEREGVRVCCSESFLRSCVEVTDDWLPGLCENYHNWLDSGGKNV